MSIIDIHAHTEFSLERLMSIHDSFENLDLRKEKFLEDLESLGIEYVFSIGKKDGQLRPFFDDLNPADLDTLVEEQKQHPFLKRIVAISLSDEGNLNQIRKYLEKEIISGIKLYLGYTIDNANSEFLKPYYDIASEFNTPVLFHLGNCYPKKNKKIVSPLDIIPVLEKYPEQRFILCHLGYPLIEDTKKIVMEFDNAFTDLSGLMTYEDILLGECEPRLKRIKPVLTTLLDDPEVRSKVMYGSDYPLVPLKQYYGVIKEIVPVEMHDKIFYENAKKFFRL